MNDLRNRVIIQHIQRRIEANKNALILIVGDTGGGKSYGAMRLLEKLDPSFNINFIEFEVDKFMELVNQDFPPGTAMMFDEVGVSMNARSWQSKLNRAMSYILQTFRFKNYIVCFTVPDMSMVDVHARKLFHYTMEARGIDQRRKVAKFSFKRVQVNRNTGDIYRKAIKYYDEGLKTAPMLKLKLADKGLVNTYEQKRKAYIDRLYSDLQNSSVVGTSQKDVKKKEKVECYKCGYVWIPNVDNPKKCPDCNTRNPVRRRRD